ncbi:MAG: iron-containing alcohol dehydrogenase [Clostridia bacterium]|nr:iron-containing alcohol dehydrogenase [Clostridia bacterium]
MNKIKETGYRIYQKVYMYAEYLMNWDEPELLKGPGSVNELPRLIKSKGISSVLVVTDKTLMKLHTLDGLFANLEEQNIKYTVFSDVQPNPSIENIEECRRIYLKNDCEGIVAFGGGSSMDCAKVAAARVANPNQTVADMRGQLKIRHKIPPLFAIPTTAGTGSEVTLAAVVTNMQTHEKYAVNDPKLRPKYAVLDPELTVGLPKHMTAATGMDALTHAVEAYIGLSSTKSTDDYAEKAVKLIFANLEEAYRNGENIQARENMLVASYYAGMAFTRAYVGYAHAIAHNLGGLYGTPHGLANAVILPHILKYYGSTAYEKLARLADIVGIDGKDDAEKAELFIKAIEDMNEHMEIPNHFDFIKDEDIPTIVERALKEGNPLYPVPKIMDKKDCEAVVREIKG